MSARKNPCANTQRKRAVERHSWRPTWRTFHALGITASQSLPVNSKWEEVGAAVGLNKQDAYHHTMVALGKVVFALRKLEK